MRIRPALQQGLPRFTADNCIHAASASSIAIAPPEASQGYRNGDRGQTYNFSRVFRETTSQREYFVATAAPMVGLAGRQSCCMCPGASVLLMQWCSVVAAALKLDCSNGGCFYTCPLCAPCLLPAHHPPAGVP